MCVNNQLLKLQQLWDEQYAKTYSKEHPQSISRPFAYGVPEEYMTADFKLMVVGQEAAGFSAYDDPTAWDLQRTQQWVVDYTRRQLWGIRAGVAEEDRRKSSPFWNFMKNLNKFGMVPSWNNVDKVYQKKTADTGEKVIRLTDDQRREFNKAVCEGKTLLQKEVEISKPDGIVFVTGPHYRHSMETALTLSENSLAEKVPREDAVLTDISHEVGLGIPCLWTYHPRRLCGLHLSLNDCAQEIAKIIKQSKV